MPEWRLAQALIEYRDAVNRRYPNRSKASDGTIGDSAHAGTGQGSDHNPWIVDGNGVGVVRAFDLTHDPANGVDCAHLSDLLLEVGKRDPRLHNDGYVIFNRWITNSDWSGWHAYTGDNPHTSHMHISFSTNAYDRSGSWDAAFDPAPKPPVVTPPKGNTVKSLIDGKEYSPEQMTQFLDFHAWRIDKIVTELGKRAGIDTTNAGLSKLT